MMIKYETFKQTEKIEKFSNENVDKVFHIPVEN